MSQFETRCGVDWYGQLVQKYQYVNNQELQEVTSHIV